MSGIWSREKLDKKRASLVMKAGTLAPSAFVRMLGRPSKWARTKHDEGRVDEERQPHPRY
jgi:hypothetical protein